MGSDPTFADVLDSLVGEVIDLETSIGASRRGTLTRIRYREIVLTGIQQGEKAVHPHELIVNDDETDPVLVSDIVRFERIEVAADSAAA